MLLLDKLNQHRILIPGQVVVELGQCREALGYVGLCYGQGVPGRGAGCRFEGLSEVGGEQIIHGFFKPGIGQAKRLAGGGQGQLGKLFKFLQESSKVVKLGQGGVKLRLQDGYTGLQMAQQRGQLISIDCWFFGGKILHNGLRFVEQLTRIPIFREESVGKLHKSLRLKVGFCGNGCLRNAADTP